MASETHSRILRLTQVRQRTGLSRTSLYEQVKSRAFPAPIKLGPRAVGWIEAEVAAWIAERIQSSRGAARA